MSDQDLEYRRHLVEARAQAQKDYDRTIVALAGGALGLSLTFLRGIVQDREPLETCSLALGWALLVLSLLAIVVSYFLSRFALTDALTRLDRDESTVHDGVWSTLTETANAIAGVALLGGISLVMYFAFVNLGSQQ